MTWSASKKDPAGDRIITSGVQNRIRSPTRLGGEKIAFKGTLDRNGNVILPVLCRLLKGVSAAHHSAEAARVKFASINFHPASAMRGSQ